MRIFLFAAVLLAIVTFGFNQLTHAQGCPVVGTTADGGDVVVCNGVEVNGVETTDQADEVTINGGSDITAPVDGVVETLDGDDKVWMFGGTVSGGADSDCIELGLGSNEFYMYDGRLLCGDHGPRAPGAAGPTKIVIEGGLIEANDECIFVSNNPDEIYISGGRLNCGNAIVQSQGGDDTVIVTGGIMTQINDTDEGIETGSDNDLISVSYAIVDGSIAQNRHAVDGGSDDDIIRLGTEARILGLSTGGSGFDTLVFEMGVPQTQIASTCAELESKDPEGDSIVINNLFYEWEDFEVILCEITAPVGLNVPTLSQWGLIAMAGALGIVGFIVARRRKVAT